MTDSERSPDVDMTEDQANELAGVVADKLLEQFLEHEPAMGLLDFNGQLHIKTGKPPIEEMLLLVAAAPFAAVVVTTDGTVDTNVDSPINPADIDLGEVEDGMRVRVVTVACLGHWRHVVLSPVGVTRVEERPVGRIPDLMEGLLPERLS
jgi:hypothetical protein